MHLKGHCRNRSDDSREALAVFLRRVLKLVSLPNHPSRPANQPSTVFCGVCRWGVLVLACDPHLGTDVNSVASGMSRSAWRVRNGNKKPLWLRRAAFRWFCVPPNIPGRAFACSRELRKSSSHVTANEVNLYALALNASGNFANHKIDTLECGNFVRLSGQTVSG